MSKRRIPTIAVILIVILVVCIGAIGYVKLAEAKLEKLSMQTMSNIDFSQIPDGEYTGRYKAFPISVEVKVTIKEHKIAVIDLIKHKNGQGKAAEVIPDRVIEKQGLDVDIVSGATYSSKVILKAIENALNSAIQ